MLEKAQCAATQETGRQVLALAAEAGVSATPIAYEVLFRYFSDPPEKLRDAVHVALKEPLADRNDALAKVHEALLSNAELADGLRRVRDGLATEISDLSSKLTAGVDGNLKMANELRRSLRDMAGMITREELQILCKHLVFSGRDQLTETQGIAARLERTQLQLKSMQAELSELRKTATRDHLTGLQNRRFLEEKLTELIDEETPFAFAMIDLDRMKDINDTWGHLVGDNILRGVGKVLRQNLKGKDFAARMGGEEFALILPATALNDAVSVCDGIRAEFAGIHWVSETTKEEIGQRTLSVGVTALRAGDTLHSLIERADKYLYTAKGEGRNLVRHGD